MSTPSRIRKCLAFVWRRRWWALGSATAIVTLLGALVLIRPDAPNPAYPATAEQINDAIERMKLDPAPLRRPVVVVSGYRSPRLSAGGLATRIEGVTGDEDMVLVVSDPLASSVDALADRIVQRVEDTWPSTEPGWTTEVDVVGISMGGLAARRAAMPRDETLRLRIGTLYTLASPHRGASLADVVALDRAAREMRTGSEMIEQINASVTDSGFEIVPYAVLLDRWVGATNAAPPGADPIWVPGRLLLSHHLVSIDRRIFADLARRLRGEAPLASPGPPPSD